MHKSPAAAHASLISPPSRHRKLGRSVSAATAQGLRHQNANARRPAPAGSVIRGARITNGSRRFGAVAPPCPGFASYLTSSTLATRTGPIAATAYFNGKTEQVSYLGRSWKYFSLKESPHLLNELILGKPAVFGILWGLSNVCIGRGREPKSRTS